jgi:histidinol dehydrogenase
MKRLNTQQAEFALAFAQLVNDRREADVSVTQVVRDILADVKKRGDTALQEYTRTFDKHDVNTGGWVITRAECEAALAALPSALREALTIAAERIRTYHASQYPNDSDRVDAEGVRMGARWSAVDSAGIYVPGGRAAYPSSVLMNAIPAKTAGVERLIMVSPCPHGENNPLVLAAAALAGVDEIWRIGGAQAIAALAYGTERIKPVDVITGPGNAYVAEAKRQVFGLVGIDMVAGPSEIVVVADKENDADWIAADLLSQSEHDPSSQSILICDDEGFASQVQAAVEKHLPTLKTQGVARQAWDAHGTIIIVQDMEEAVPLINALAPEHLEIATQDPHAVFNKVRHAGSVFLGQYSPEAMGDYLAGPNHVLPTGRRARFASGLSVLDFMKRTSYISVSQAAFATLAPHVEQLALAEGLPAHALSISVRRA